MATPQAGVLRHLRQLVAAQQANQASDEVLVRRFTAGQDGAAFEALVERHGLMVLRLCRRVLQNAHDAEDAFQATFLVLARKAGSIRKQRSVSSWLYGVASRVAHEARRDALRRRAREQRPLLASQADPGAELTWREVGRVLEEELERLPDRYRGPLVLCFLESKTRDEAARQLGWSLGTFRRRLDRGRELLRARLTRRGVTLPAALWAVGMSQGMASASLPGPLTAATVGAALAFAAGAGKSGAVAARVAGLAEAVLKSMSAVRIKVGVVLLALTVVAAGVGVLGRQNLVAKPPESKQARGSGPGVMSLRPAKPVRQKPARIDLYGDPLPPGALARLGTVRLRHGSHVLAVAFPPDGKSLISTGNDATVRAWDLATARELRQQRYTQVGVACATFSPDTRLLAAADIDDTVHLWEVRTGKELRRFRAPGDRVKSVAFSADVKTLASAGARKDPAIRLWDVATGKELRQLKGHREWVRFVVFSPDGKTLASGSRDQTVRLWDVATGKELRRLPEQRSRISPVAFSPKGEFLAWVAGDNTIRLMDPGKGKELRRFQGQPKRIHTLTFSPDGKVLASVGVDQAIRLWRVGTGKEFHRIPDVPGPGALAFSGNGKVLAAAGSDMAVRLWEVATGKELRRSGVHHSGVRSLALSPDGKVLVSSGGVLQRWNPATGKELRPLPERRFAGLAVALSPDGKVLASVNRDRVVLWDVAAGKELRQLPGHKGLIRSLAFALDGKTLASAGDDRAVRLWEVATGKELRQCQGHASMICSLAFAPDGKAVASASWDKTIRIWEAGTGKELHRLAAGETHEAVAWSPDGRHLASAGQDGMICLWDAASRKQVHRFRAHPWGPCCLAFSPDSRTLALGSWDRTVRLWEVATGQERCRFLGHRGGVNAVVFFPDGRRVASASEDTTVLVWDVTGRVQDGRLPAKEVSADDLASLWAALAGEDAAKAHQSLWSLVATPRQAVALLEKQVRPVEAVEPRRARRLISDLDDRKFAVRKKAGAELEKLGEAVESDLRQALQETPSAEARQRLQALLDKLQGRSGSPEQLRRLRALEVLEQVGTSQARRLLKRLAQGAPQVLLTEEAKAVLQRLDRRDTVNP
jgi:RNA polymerase sigma factor (sigma-70 family)